MQRPEPHPRPRRPLPTWALVGLLHGAVLMLLWSLPPTADRTGTAVQQPALLVRLLESVREHTTPAPSPPRQPRVALPLPRPPEPLAISVPADAPPGPAAPATSPTTVGPTAASAPPAPLNLNLPLGASAPWRQRNPALDDPRANTPKLTMEQKLANAMGGDGSWHEERLDLDTVRFRRGNECLLAKRSRAGQLELGNGAFRNSWLVSRC